MVAGLEGLEPHYDFVIVGAGLSGFVFAEQAAARFGYTSLIIDKRDHIGVRPSARLASPATHGLHTQHHSQVDVSPRLCAPGLWRHVGESTRPCTKLGACHEAPSHR
jgi:choline dehydrogenase-like flavoprotein